MKAAGARVAVFLWVVLLCVIVAQPSTARSQVTAADHFRRGVELHEKGDLDGAIGEYTRAIDSGQLSTWNLASALDNRGNAYDDKGEHDRAIQDHDQAIRLNPNYAAAFNNRGVAYGRKGDYDRAIQDYDQAIRLNPNYVLAFNNRGFDYRRKGDYDRAIQDYDQALRLNPNYVLALSSRGVCYHNKGDYDHAIQDYDQVIRLNPDSAWGFRTRGVARFEQGQFAAAIADFASGVKLAPRDPYQLIWLYLARARAGQKAEEALSGAQQLDLKTWPGPVISLYQATIGPKAVLEAAANPNPKKQREQLCEAHFYLGEYDLLHGLQKEANGEFQTASDTCPLGFTEYWAAKVELKRHGH